MNHLTEDDFRVNGIRVNISGSKIRVGIHFYNNENDLQSLIDYLKIFSAKRDKLELSLLLFDPKVIIMVTDLDSEEYYYYANLKDSFALVIGNENRGANDIWRKAAYKKIKIPILGSTESLNSSVAAGISLYDAVRQRLG